LSQRTQLYFEQRRGQAQSVDTLKPVSPLHTRWLRDPKVFGDIRSTRLK